MRALFTSIPGMGHIHPMVPLAHALQRAGHEVIWATGPEACEGVERYGFTTMPAGPRPGERANLPSQPPAATTEVPPRERRQAIFAKRFGAAANRMRQDLAPIVDAVRPDLIVHDAAEFAAAPIASARGIPHVTVAFSGELSDALVASIAQRTAEMWGLEGLEVPPDAGLYQHLYLHPFPPSFGAVPTSKTARPLRPVGFDGSPGIESPPWLRDVGIHRPAIYATLGTVVSSVAAWRDLLAAIDSLDIDAIATIGSQIDPEQLGPIPANVRVEGYLPQSFVLNRVAVVVSHTGAGTMLAAAAHGLPQLCAPMGADQWANADALNASGASITLEEDQRDAAAMRAGIQRLLDESTFAASAAHVAAEIAGLPHPDDYVDILETLASR